MADLTLAATSALGGYRTEIGGVRLAERTGLAIVSIAVPRDGEAALAEALQAGFGADLPRPGRSSLSRDGATRLLGMAADQLFAVFDHEGPDAARGVGAALGTAAYASDQSDVWVALRLEGAAVRRALERICPLDLHADAFAEGQVARTVIEHLGAIVLRDGPHALTLFSARSSARAFLHALETSLRNVA